MNARILLLLPLISCADEMERAAPAAKQEEPPQDEGGFGGGMDGPRGRAEAAPAPSAPAEVSSVVMDGTLEKEKDSAKWLRILADLTWAWCPTFNPVRTVRKRAVATWTIGR